MLLAIAFALFILLVVAWIAMPTASNVQRCGTAVAAGLPAMGSRSA